MKGGRFLRLHLIYWIVLPAFYALKERELSLSWVLLQFFSFAVAGFTITYFYYKNIERISFPYDNFQAIGRKIGKTIAVLSLVVVGYDFMADHYYYKIGFNTDSNYSLTLAGYYIDGIIIFIPWFLFFHLYKYGKKIGELNKTYAEQQVELQQAQLQIILNKLNPHFLFNTLNTIRWLITKDKEMARLAVNELSEIMRYATRTDSSGLVSLQEELLIVEKYLKIEHWRYDENLDYVLHCESYLLDRVIVPFLILNIVENAVKHGISQQLQGGVIEIKIYEFKAYMFIEVTNPGEVEEIKSGFGLVSIDKLLKSRFGSQSHVSITGANNVVKTVVKLQHHAS